MGVDLNFWKYEKNTYLDNAVVYQNACCNHEKVEGLEVLPIEDILKEIAAAFHDWNAIDLFNYEKKDGQGSFQMATTPQTVRFDKIVTFLIDEAGEYKTQAEHEFSRLLPRLEIITKLVNWDEYVSLSKELNHIHYNAIIHRAKTLTKVTSYMQFGKGWSSRPCQCKTAQLADKDKAHQVLEELVQKSIERVVNDFLERTYYA